MKESGHALLRARANHQLELQFHHKK